ncbi:ABC transporter family substrate-binding protein [Nonomuraea sp. NPDC050394]|uniref:ABC transporter family substrate-binding protein n=1 Tax=Nonomuraea sp. NPDC050394 TaxID=3364363 RepID=UPI00379C32D6
MRALLVAGMLLLTACGVPDGQSLVRAATLQAWTGFNPHTPNQGNSIGLAIGNLIYPSPFVIGTDLRPVLNRDLLDSAQLTETSPQTVVYKIRRGARWSDGTPITAGDFIYLWRHMSGRVKGAQLAAAVGYDAVADVRSSQAGASVTVVFSRPFGEWRSLFAQLLPAHFMRGRDWNTGLATTVPPGAGPFTVASNQAGQYLRLRRNPNWDGPRPRLDGLDLIYVKDTQAAVQALANGELDLATLDPGQGTMSQLKAVPYVRADLVASTDLQLMAFQFGHPLTGTPAVREAVATALDISQLAAKTFGSGAAAFLSANHVIARGAPGYTDNLPGGYGRGDAAGAARVLEAAGYVRGANGYFAKNGRTLELRHTVASGSAIDTQIAVLAQAMLKPAGIKLVVVTVPDSVYFDRVLIPGDYDTLSFRYPGSAYPVSWSLALYGCEGGYNFQRFCDKRVDERFAEAIASTDESRRLRLADGIDARLWDSLALMPLFTVPALVARSTRLTGFRAHPLSEWQLAGAAAWGLT